MTRRRVAAQARRARTDDLDFAPAIEVAAAIRTKLSVHWNLPDICSPHLNSCGQFGTEQTGISSFITRCVEPQPLSESTQPLQTT